MSNFLDKTGLSYFWEKVKSWSNNRFYKKTGGDLDGDIRFVKKEGQVARSISFGNSGADGASLTFSENGIQFSGPDGADLNMSGRKIENVGDPSLDGDAVNYKLLKDRTASAPRMSDIGKVLTVSEWNDAPYLMWETIPTELPEGGTEGQVLSKTTDGVQWGDLPNSLVLASLQAKFPEVKTWKHLAYGNGRYVATPNSGNSYAYSDDLINWTIGTLPYSVSGSIVYGEGTSGGVFVVGQAGGDSRVSLMYSFDGAAWNSCNINRSFTPFTISFGNGVFVGICASEMGPGEDVYTSDDGINWTKVDAPGLVSDSWSRTDFCNNRFVAVSYNSIGTSGNRVAYSTDGSTWEESTMPDSVPRTNAAYGNGIYLILDRNEHDLNGFSTYISEDGVTWNVVRVNQELSANWSSLSYGNGLFVAVEYGGSRAIYSSNGTTWSESVLPKSDNWEKVIWDGSKFVAIAYSSDSIAISIDGITWTSDIEKQVQDSSGIDVTEDVATAIFPEGGSAGQVLKKTETGTEWGDVDGGLTQEEADDRYLQLTGGTVNGDINVGSYNNKKSVIFDGPNGYFMEPPPEFSNTRVSLYCDNTISTSPPGQFSVAAPYFVIDGDRPILIKAKSIDMNQKKIFNLADPTDDYQAANKRYVDSKAPKSVAITLSASSWSNNAQTVMVNGVFADESKQIIQPTPKTTSQSAYYEAGVMCTAQALNRLTFSCQTVPTEDLEVYVVIQEVGA